MVLIQKQGKAKGKSQKAKGLKIKKHAPIFRVLLF
jgi:hypothetical protein